MTKKELIDALEGLSDDANVYVYCTTYDGGEWARDIYFSDKVCGKDAENEITICAHF